MSSIEHTSDYVFLRTASDNLFSPLINNSPPIPISNSPIQFHSFICQTNYFDVPTTISPVKPPYEINIREATDSIPQFNI